MFNTLLSYVGAGPLSPRSRPSLGPRDVPDPISRRSVSPPYVKMDYSLVGFQNIVEDLIAIAGDAENPVSSISGSPEELVEVIRGIAETLLWGEQNEEDSLMFDYFCEKGVMKIFVSLLNSPTSRRQIKVQLLQTMSLLVLNIKRQQSLYFLFSNNAINMLISSNCLDFSDEEILSYYVSFMKSISLRLSSETIKLFINEKLNYFPLFVQSIRFFDHHDRMIRNAVRTITLSVFKLMEKSKSLERIVQENAGGYFTLLACQLRDVWFLIDKKDMPNSSIRVLMEELIDQLEYVADIDRLGFRDLSQLLVEKVNLFAIDSVLLNQATTEMASNAEKPEMLSMSTKLFVISRFLAIWPNEKIQAFFLQLDMRKPLANMSPEFVPLMINFTLLLRADPKRLSEYGLIPPGSIELTLLVCQSVGKTLDRFSKTMVRLVAFFLFEVLQLVGEEYKRPILLTISDSWRTVCQKTLSILNDSIAPQRNSFAVIDAFENVFAQPFTFPTKLEMDKMATNPSIFTPSTSRNTTDPNLTTVVLELFVEQLHCVQYLLGQSSEDLFSEYEVCEEKESLVDLGAKSRIACTHISSQIRSTRYLLMDELNLVLVAPDLTQPGFGQVMFSTCLRKITEISIDKNDPKLLRIALANNPDILLLAFEDVKRCNLALVHLETKSTQIRRDIFHKIQSYIKQFTV